MYLGTSALNQLVEEAALIVCASHTTASHELEVEREYWIRFFGSCFVVLGKTHIPVLKDKW